MLIKRRRISAGVTLVEAVVAVALLAVAVLGASGYRYYAALDSRKAGMHRTAAAIALLTTDCTDYKTLIYTDITPAEGGKLAFSQNLRFKLADSNKH